MTLIGLLSYTAGCFYGSFFATETLDSIAYLESIHFYEGSKHITGIVDKELSSRERSHVYRLSLDMIDTISTHIPV